MTQTVALSQPLMTPPCCLWRAQKYSAPMKTASKKSDQLSFLPLIRFSRPPNLSVHVAGITLHYPLGILTGCTLHLAQDCVSPAGSPLSKFRQPTCSSAVTAFLFTKLLKSLFSGKHQRSQGIAFVLLYCSHISGRGRLAGRMVLEWVAVFLPPRDSQSLTLGRSVSFLVSGRDLPASLGAGIFLDSLTDRISTTEMKNKSTKINKHFVLNCSNIQSLDLILSSLFLQILYSQPW